MLLTMNAGMNIAALHRRSLPIADRLLAHRLGRDPAALAQISVQVHDARRQGDLRRQAGSGGGQGGKDQARHVEEGCYGRTPKETEALKKIEAERPRNAGSNQRAQRRSRRSLRKMEAEREKVREPLEGERIGTVGGGGRLTDSYWERQKKLRKPAWNRCAMRLREGSQGIAPLVTGRCGRRRHESHGAQGEEHAFRARNRARSGSRRRAKRWRGCSPAAPDSPSITRARGARRSSYPRIIGHEITGRDRGGRAAASPG